MRQAHGRLAQPVPCCRRRLCSCSTVAPGSAFCDSPSLSQPALRLHTTPSTTPAAPAGSLSFVDLKAGGVVKRAVVTLTVDGYSAPISAGNFVANVLDGLYNNR